MCGVEGSSGELRMSRVRAGIGYGVAVALLAGTGALRADDRPKGPEEDGTKPALTRIAGEGFLNSHALQYLTELSDDIGSRVTGSPAERKAEEWGAAKMKAIGLENVHLEKYTIWKGWTRGSTEAELLAPTRRKLHIDSMGWTGSTAAGGVEADVVKANLFAMDDEIKNAARLKGKLILMVHEGQPKQSGVMIF